jgi:hypothetical protein
VVQDLRERNRLRNLQQALLLAASDMGQAIAAAKALQKEPDVELARALETAIANCYMRPFTGGPPGRLPDAFGPTTEPDAGYHSDLATRRHKTYAHTDKASGRSTTVELVTRDGEAVTVAFREQWLPLPRKALPRLIDYLERQQERFKAEAASIHVQLQGLGPSRDA